MQTRKINLDNWEHLELHPLCSLFPEMGEKDFDSLLESMNSQGFLDTDPIVLIMDEEEDEWQILDGQNRFYAAKQTQVTPHFVQYKGEDPLSFVMARNFDRRHLTTGQKAAIAASISDLGEGITQAEAAKQIGVGEASLRRFKFIQTRDPELAKEVAKGDIKMEEARNRIKQMEQNMPQSHAELTTAPPADNEANKGYKLGDKRKAKLAKMTKVEVTIHAKFQVMYDPEKQEYADQLAKAISALEKGGLAEVEVINEGDDE